MVDSVHFFNEIELLMYRMKILNDVVDKFVITEYSLTHSGQKKDFYFEQSFSRFKAYEHKIIHNTIHYDFNSIETKLPKNKYRIHGLLQENIPERYLRDMFQRDATIEALSELPDDSWIITSDLDEIPDPRILSKLLKDMENPLSNYVYCLLQTMHYYQPLNVADFLWAGSRIIRKDNLFQNFTVDELRIPSNLHNQKIIPAAGWHFSYFGDFDFINQKLLSFAHSDSYTRKVKRRLRKNLGSNKDIFGRKKMKFIRDFNELGIPSLKDLHDLGYN